MTQAKNNSSLVSLLLLLVLIVIGVFWFKPNFDQVGTLNTEKATKEEQKKALDAQLATLTQASATLDQTGEISKEAVLAAIPEHYEQDKLITTINDMARKNSINIGSISFSVPSGGNSDGGIQKSTISVSLTGSEQNLINFLKAVEMNPRKMVVKNITVQLGQADGQASTNFSLSMETYFQSGI